MGQTVPSRRFERRGPPPVKRAARASGVAGVSCLYALPGSRESCPEKNTLGHNGCGLDNSRSVTIQWTLGLETSRPSNWRNRCRCRSRWRCAPTRCRRVSRRFAWRRIDRLARMLKRTKCILNWAAFICVSLRGVGRRSQLCPFAHYSPERESLFFCFLFAFFVRGPAEWRRLGASASDSVHSKSLPFFVFSF